MNYGLSPVYSMCLLFRNIQVYQNEKRVILTKTNSRNEYSNKPITDV